MADPVAIVQNIIDIAIIIAVETDRQNKEECLDIQKLVCRVSDVLSLLKETEMMKHREVAGPLEDLADAVRRALSAGTASKKRGKNILCIVFKANKLSKKLSQVKNDISQGMMLAIFATHAAAVFVASKGQQSALNFNVFFLHTHQQTPPLFEHLPLSRAVTEDFPLSVLTNEPYCSPDAVVSDGLHPCLRTQIQDPPDLAPITDDVPNNLEPPFYVHIYPLPHSHPHTKVDPIEFKHLSRRPPKQPPTPPPHMTTSIPPLITPPPSLPPSSLSPPTDVTSPVSEHQTHRPPTRLPLPLPSTAPSNAVIASMDAQKPGNLIHPSALVPPGSPLQSTMEIPLPVSSSVPTASPEDASMSDERKNKSEQADGPSTLLPGLRKFSLSELRDATNNFSERNKIGSSDFGIFYKGVLADGLKVVIKEFQNPPQFLLGRLSAKLHLASKLQSKHVEASGNNMYIIRVLGYGHELIWARESFETHVFLVEEYLSNGNMYNIIYGYRLHWTSRFRIIQGLAQGLQYLHEQNIVHMNVKPANVLLDSDMNPKITDFGIARLLEKPIIHDNNIAGTVGYMPPEYILEGTLSTTYDVHSFGVTLLETISSMCKTDPVRHHASVPWAWNVRRYQQMGELFDSSVFEESQITEIKRCLEIGLLCTQSERAKRPTMASVFEMLNGKKMLTTPRQPEYTKGRVIYR